jgi:hypothetical protein
MFPYGHENSREMFRQVQIKYIKFYRLARLCVDKLRGLSPQANYIDQATAACRRS